VQKHTARLFSHPQSLKPAKRRRSGRTQNIFYVAQVFAFPSFWLSHSLWGVRRTQSAIGSMAGETKIMKTFFFITNLCKKKKAENRKGKRAKFFHFY
jgi:hypothetical protein